MADIYSGGGGSRRTAVFVGIIGLHFLFYLALVSGLAREAMELAQDVGIIDLPPPPPPPEDLKEPPPPPPTDLPPPVVPPPLIDLPTFTGPTTAISAEVSDKPQQPAPRVVAPPPRPVQVTAPSAAYNARALANALNSCYPSASRRLSEEGRVLAVVTIGTNGRMSALQVSQSSGFNRLDEAAECVVRKLKFNPGTRDGQPVEMQVTLPVVFKLE